MSKSRKVVVEFSGWLEAKPDAITLVDKYGVCKTAEAWLATRGNLDGLTLDDFGATHRTALRKAFVSLDITLETVP